MRGSCTRKNSQRGVKSVIMNSNDATSPWIDLAVAEQQPVVRLEVAAEIAESFSDAMLSLSARRWSKERPSPNTLGLMQLLLQLELELDPGQRTVVQGLDPHMHEAVGVVSGVVERADRPDGADDQDHRRCGVQFLGDDDRIGLGAFAGHRNDPEAAELGRKTVGAADPPLLVRRLLLGQSRRRNQGEQAESGKPSPESGPLTRKGEKTCHMKAV